MKSGCYTRNFTLVSAVFLNAKEDFRPGGGTGSPPKSPLRSSDRSFLEQFFAYLLDTAYFPSKVRAPNDRLRKLQELSKLLREVAPFPQAGFLADVSGLTAQTSNYVFYRGHRTATFAPAQMGNIGELKRLYVAWVVARLLWPNKVAYAAVREQLGKKELRTEKAIYQSVTRFVSRSRTLESYGSSTSQPLMAVKDLYLEFLQKERLQGKRSLRVQFSRIRNKLLQLALDRKSTPAGIFDSTELIDQQIAYVRNILSGKITAVSPSLYRHTLADSAANAREDDFEEEVNKAASKIVIAMWSQVRESHLQLAKIACNLAAVPGFDGTVRVGYHINPEVQFVADEPHDVVKAGQQRDDKQYEFSYYLQPRMSFWIEWIEHSGTSLF